MVARGKKLMQKGMDPNNAALANGTPVHRAQLNEVDVVVVESDVYFRRQ